MVSQATSVPTEGEDGTSYDIVDPRPDALVESLRAFGYSPQAAVADLVDNSIAAGARIIRITFMWDGSNSWVRIHDDGTGMTPSELVSAMRPGSRSPLATREQHDLGRFGLGLKTASFSQGRRLTVRSSTRGDPVVSTRRWDLDYIGATAEWRLLVGAAPESAARFDPMTQDGGGTQVLWERLDRLVGDAGVGDRKAARRFLDLVSSVEEHLAMTFHRYLTRRGGLTIQINGRTIDPWDPFLEGEAATQRLPEEVLPLASGRVRVQPFVLPHHSRLDPSTHRRAAGPGGWNAQQGFYIYRNARLLVAGDWLGLFQKEEHYKLARIAVDLTNAMDHDWDIDVRKSRARPPGMLRDDLRRIAHVTRERAADVYRHRGKRMARAASGTHTFVWDHQVMRGKMSYRINRTHPLVAEALAVPGPYRPAVRALLRLIEETIPVPMIMIDGTEHPEQQATPFDDVSTPEVRRVALHVYRALRRTGLSVHQTRERLLTMEPFDRFTELVMSLDDEGDAMEDDE